MFGIMSSVQTTSTLAQNISGYSGIQYTTLTSPFEDSSYTDEFEPKFLELFLKDNSKMFLKTCQNDVVYLKEFVENNETITCLKLKNGNEFECKCSANVILNMLNIKYESFSEYNIKTTLNGEN